MATPTTLPASFVSGAVLTASQMNNLRGAFRVLQLSSVTKTDTFTTSSNTYTDVTGLSITITPSATTSQILLIANLSINGVAAQTGAPAQFVRGATAIGNGAAAGSRGVAMVVGEATSGGSIYTYPMTFLDSPATTSATTYKIQARSNKVGETIYVNRSVSDTDSATFFRVSSTLTVMEISA